MNMFWDWPFDSKGISFHEQVQFLSPGPITKFDHFEPGMLRKETLTEEERSPDGPSY
jgi:hypothetical protein